MARPTRFPKTPVRYPRFPYKGSSQRPWPHSINEGPGPLQMDALSGAFFPAIYTYDGPYGPVNAQNGAVCDYDLPEREMQVTMEGPIPASIQPNGGEL